MAQAKIVRNEVGLEEFRNSIKEKLNMEVNEIILNGFLSKRIIASTKKNHYYATTDHDQRNFMGKHAILMQDPSIKEVMWKTQDAGTFVKHTREEFLEICREVMAHIENHVAKNVFLKQSIDRAKTKEEIILMIQGTTQ